MELPKRFKKRCRTYILIKEYKNFGLYEEERTKFRECFDRFDLGITGKQPKPINNKVYNVPII